MKVMDILDHQRHCTWNSISTRGIGLRHVVFHKLLHQALAISALVPNLLAIIPFQYVVECTGAELHLLDESLVEDYVALNKRNSACHLA